MIRMQNSCRGSFTLKGEPEMSHHLDGSAIDARDSSLWRPQPSDMRWDLNQVNPTTDGGERSTACVRNPSVSGQHRMAAEVASSCESGSHELPRQQTPQSHVAPDRFSPRKTAGLAQDTSFTENCDFSSSFEGKPLYLVILLVDSISIVETSLRNIPFSFRLNWISESGRVSSPPFFSGGASGSHSDKCGSSMSQIRMPDSSLCALNWCTYVEGSLFPPDDSITVFDQSKTEGNGHGAQDHTPPSGLIYLSLTYEDTNENLALASLHLSDLGASDVFRRFSIDLLTTAGTFAVVTVFVACQRRWVKLGREMFERQVDVRGSFVPNFLDVDSDDQAQFLQQFVGNEVQRARKSSSVPTESPPSNHFFNEQNQSKSEGASGHAVTGSQPGSVSVAAWPENGGPESRERFRLHRISESAEEESLNNDSLAESVEEGQRRTVGTRPDSPPVCNGTDDRESAMSQSSSSTVQGDCARLRGACWNSVDQVAPPNSQQFKTQLHEKGADLYKKIQERCPDLNMSSEEKENLQGVSREHGVQGGRHVCSGGSLSSSRLTSAENEQHFKESSDECSFTKRRAPNAVAESNNTGYIKDRVLDFPQCEKTITKAHEILDPQENNFHGTKDTGVATLSSTDNRIGPRAAVRELFHAPSRCSSPFSDTSSRKNASQCRASRQLELLERAIGLCVALCQDVASAMVDDTEVKEATEYLDTLKALLRRVSRASEKSGLLSEPSLAQKEKTPTASATNLSAKGIPKINTSLASVAGKKIDAPDERFLPEKRESEVDSMEAENTHPSRQVDTAEWRTVKADGVATHNTVPNIWNESTTALSYAHSIQENNFFSFSPTRIRKQLLEAHGCERRNDSTSPESRKERSKKVVSNDRGGSISDAVVWRQSAPWKENMQHVTKATDVVREHFGDSLADASRFATGKCRNAVTRESTCDELNESVSSNRSDTQPARDGVLFSNVDAVYSAATDTTVHVEDASQAVSSRGSSRGGLSACMALKFPSQQHDESSSVCNALTASYSNKIGCGSFLPSGRVPEQRRKAEIASSRNAKSEVENDFMAAPSLRRRAKQPTESAGRRSCAERLPLVGDANTFENDFSTQVFRNTTENQSSYTISRHPTVDIHGIRRRQKKETKESVGHAEECERIRSTVESSFSAYNKTSYWSSVSQTKEVAEESRVVFELPSGRATPCSGRLKNDDKPVENSSAWVDQRHCSDRMKGYVGECHQSDGVTVRRFLSKTDVNDIEDGNEPVAHSSVNDQISLSRMPTVPGQMTSDFVSRRSSQSIQSRTSSIVTNASTASVPMLYEPMYSRYPRCPPSPIKGFSKDYIPSFHLPRPFGRTVSSSDDKHGASNESDIGEDDAGARRDVSSCSSILPRSSSFDRRVDVSTTEKNRSLVQPPRPAPPLPNRRHVGPLATSTALPRTRLTEPPSLGGISQKL